MTVVVMDWDRTTRKGESRYYYSCSMTSAKLASNLGNCRHKEDGLHEPNRLQDKDLPKDGFRRDSLCNSNARSSFV